ncbi:hypothetical protein [Roseivirga thermotolerans]|uniref:hypothetical protein n=1 Tax=Roseivirga thermotolerans TaxID=1758176 RepID=UPI00273E1B61|nr:hypothetical protein [Roseivirga thermotolerans]
MRTAALRIPAFLLVASGIIFISLWLMTSPNFISNRSLLAVGSSIDIALIIPLIYFLFIRNSSFPKITVVPVFILSLIMAFQVIPDDYHATLNRIKMLVAPIELGVIGFLIYKVIQLNKNLSQTKGGLRNFPERMKAVLLDMKAKPVLANIASSECSLFYYTFAGWAKPQALASNEFSYYLESGYKSVFVLVLFLLPVETFVLHYWLMIISPTLAWILTGISIYSLFFIFGDRNAMRHRPIFLDQDSLSINIGIRWSFELPYHLIDKIELREGDAHSEKFVNLSSFGHGNVVISLREKLHVQGIYGIKKSTDKLVLSIDSEDKFFASLSKRITA